MTVTVRLFKNTSEKRWGAATLPPLGPSGRTQYLVWVGPLFVLIQRSI